MNIKFKNNQKQLNEIKLNELKISDIKLASENPRYTTLDSFETNLIDKIRNSINDKYNENNVKNVLLSYEGDFSDLNSLFKSIYDRGFKTELDPIILIKDSLLNGSNKYIVAEGNRRMMCLKMICKELNFNDINNIENINSQENLLTDEDFETENYYKKRKKNHKNIFQLIEKIQKINKDIIVDIKITENDNDLWGLIYTKHIVGEKPGMRKWSRGKYFTDVLSCFKDGINLNDLKLSNIIKNKWQRKPQSLISDFKHAQFVMEVLKRSESLTPIMDINEKKIYQKMKKIKVTALQYNFSLKRIKDSANEFLYINAKEFENEFLKFSYDKKNNLLNFHIDKKLNEICYFIYSNFKKNIITTRPIDPKYKDSFNIEVQNILLKIPIGNINDENLLDKLNSFDYSLEELDENIKKWEKKGFKKSKIERFKITKKIKENNKLLKKFITIFKKQNNIFTIFNKPLIVFFELSKQYDHNIPKNFLNAMSSTLRSILEQIFIWGFYYYVDENRKEKILEKISTGKIHCLFSEIKKEIWSKENDDENNIKNTQKILKMIFKTKKDSEAIFIYKNKDEINKFLNEIIHAHHRTFKKGTFDEYLKKFENWQKNIINILIDINQKKIEELSEKIEEVIRKSEF